jgi:hypothetical protein
MGNDNKESCPHTWRIVGDGEDHTEIHHWCPKCGALKTTDFLDNEMWVEYPQNHGRGPCHVGGGELG